MIQVHGQTRVVVCDDPLAEDVPADRHHGTGWMPGTGRRVAVVETVGGLPSGWLPADPDDRTVSVFARTIDERPRTDGAFARWLKAVRVSTRRLSGFHAECPGCGSTAVFDSRPDKGSANWFCDDCNQRMDPVPHTEPPGVTDCLYREWYDAGVRPAWAARRAIKVVIE